MCLHWGSIFCFVSLFFSRKWSSSRIHTALVHDVTCIYPSMGNCEQLELLLFSFFRSLQWKTFFYGYIFHTYTHTRARDRWNGFHHAFKITQKLNKFRWMEKKHESIHQMTNEYVRCVYSSSILCSWNGSYETCIQKSNIMLKHKRLTQINCERIVFLFGEAVFTFPENRFPTMEDYTYVVKQYGRLWSLYCTIICDYHQNCIA